MNAVAPMRWQWEPAPHGLVPQAAVAWGVDAPRLVDCLARMDGDRTRRLTGCCGASVVVVMGPVDDLPWFDGVQYAAPSAAAPALWLPTLRHPALPHELLGRALASHHRGREPLLLWPSPDRVVPLDRQAPVGAAWLQHAGQALAQATA